jgi:hypothetical protein
VEGYYTAGEWTSGKYNLVVTRQSFGGYASGAQKRTWAWLHQKRLSNSAGAGVMVGRELSALKTDVGGGLSR